jgi:iron complex outermembrane receptor protein/vitamin B12 transporter
MRVRVYSILCVWLLLFSGSAATAGAADAVISGTVVDQLGGAIDGASVTLTRDGRAIKEARTDKTGRFEIVVAEPGRYGLEAVSPGFLMRVVDTFFVAGGSRLSQTLTLSIGLHQAETVTASATELPVSQVAAPVTVIDRQTMDAIGKSSVVEALRLVPGVHVVQAGARGASSSLFVRGGNSYFNKVLIDGVPANDIGGAYDFADLATIGVERVEVLRDANSVLYGTDALAGVVNLTTRRGTTRVPELTYSVDGGNFGTQNHELSFGGTAERVDYFVAVSNFDTDNATPNSDYRNRKLVSRLGWSAGNTDISAIYRAGNGRVGLPGTAAYYGMADDSRKTAADRLFSLSADSRISPRLKTTVRFAALHSTYDTLNPSPTGEAFDPFGFGANYLGNAVTISGANGYSTTGRAILDFGGGAFPAPYSATTNRQLALGQATYRTTTVLSLSGGVRLEHEDGRTRYSTNPEAATDRTNIGAFVEAQAVGNRVMANAGLGLDDNAVFGFKATPRVSVAVYLRNPSATGRLGDTKVSVNAGTGVKAPNIGQELSSLYAVIQQSGTPIPGLKPIAPEEARSFDVGVEQGLWQGRARLRASYFDNDFTNVIEYVSSTALPELGVSPEAAAATGYGAFFNSSSYRAKGLELSAEGVVQHLRFSASYTFLDAVVTKSFSSDVLAPSENPAFPGIRIGAYAPLVGARPFRRPTHVANFLAAWVQGDVDLAFAGYVSGKQDDSTFLTDGFFGSSMLLPNHDLLAGHSKFDLSGGYRFAKTVRGYVSVENLFDGRYEAAAGFPALPRTWRAGLKISVGGGR